MLYNIVTLKETRGDIMRNTYMTSEETNKVKSYMVRAGYNITSLAETIGISREMLSARLSGKVDFGRTEMNNIAAALNIPPDVIFFEYGVTQKETDNTTKEV